MHTSVLYSEVPDAFCIQLVRFSNQVAKIKIFVEYPEVLKVQKVEFFFQGELVPCVCGLTSWQ